MGSWGMYKIQMTSVEEVRWMKTGQKLKKVSRGGFQTKETWNNTTFMDCKVAAGLQTPFCQEAKKGWVEKIY
jgi:hypothetical protein